VRRMKEVAQKHGFRTLATRVCLADVPRIPLPSIALVKRRHYVVVEALAPDGSLIIIEPSIGRCRLGVSRFLKACSGEMLLFLSNAECPTRENRV
jgi:ABC-type bacteriocin/lantibiotic exporter with double-glycine peptidase domain